MHRKYATKRGYDLSFDSETRFFTSYPSPLGIKDPSAGFEYVLESLQQRLE
jgi:hypothetical protein